MRTRSRFAPALAAALLAAATVQAQAQVMVIRGGEGMFDHIATVLNLTAAQKTSAKQFHDALHTKAAPLFEQSKQQWTEIHALLAGDNPDATQVGEKVIAAHATQVQLKALHDEFDSQLATILTADQKAKWSEMQQMRKQLEIDGHPGHPGPLF